MIKKAKMQEKIKAAKNEVLKDVVEEEVSLEKASIINEEPAKDEVDKDSFDFNNLEISKSKGKKRDAVSGGGVGALSVINSSNGMRVTLGAEVYKKIKSPKKLQVGFFHNKIAIFQSLPDNENFFEPRGKGESKKALIYSADLVREITERYNLDYSNGVSKTFYDVEYRTIDGILVALVTIEEE